MQSQLNPITHPEIRRMYESGTGREMAFVTFNDDEYLIEGDRLGYDLTVSHRLRYERRRTDITDSITGVYGVTNAEVVREVTESMATQPVQLGWAA